MEGPGSTAWSPMEQRQRQRRQHTECPAGMVAEGVATGAAATVEGRGGGWVCFHIPSAVWPQFYFSLSQGNRGQQDAACREILDLLRQQPTPLMWICSLETPYQTQQQEEEEEASQQEAAGAPHAGMSIPPSTLAGDSRAHAQREHQQRPPQQQQQQQQHRMPQHAVSHTQAHAQSVPDYHFHAMDDRLPHPQEQYQQRHSPYPESSPNPSSTYRHVAQSAGTKGGENARGPDSKSPGREEEEEEGGNVEEEEEEDEDEGGGGQCQQIDKQQEYEARCRQWHQMQLQLQHQQQHQQYQLQAMEAVGGGDMEQQRQQLQQLYHPRFGFPVPAYAPFTYPQQCFPPLHQQGEAEEAMLPPPSHTHTRRACKKVLPRKSPHNGPDVNVPGYNLPYRPGRLCRFPHCPNRYRSPGFVCEKHGGGKCEWTGCPRLHQGRQGLDYFFFCRAHRKSYANLQLLEGRERQDAEMEDVEGNAEKRITRRSIAAQKQDLKEGGWELDEAVSSQESAADAEGGGRKRKASVNVS